MDHRVHRDGLWCRLPRCLHQAVRALRTLRDLLLGRVAGALLPPPELWFIIKTFFVMTAMLLPRGVMPRVRIDILIRAGWGRLLVLSFANLFITMFLVSLGVLHIGGL